MGGGGGGGGGEGVMKSSIQDSDEKNLILRCSSGSILFWCFQYVKFAFPSLNCMNVLPKYQMPVLQMRWDKRG